jgi:hypothetical protein
MAGSLTAVAKLEFLKIATGQATSIITTTPYTPFLAFYTTAPTDSTTGVEVAIGSGGYARKDTTGLWGTPVAGQVANSAAITLAAFTGSVAGGAPFVAFGLWTALTGGTLMIYGTLTDATKTFGASDTAAFPIGSLTLVSP